MLKIKQGYWKNIQHPCCQSHCNSVTHNAIFHSVIEAFPMFSLLCFLYMLIINQPFYSNNSNSADFLMHFSSKLTKKKYIYLRCTSSIVYLQICTSYLSPIILNIHNYLRSHPVSDQPGTLGNLQVNMHDNPEYLCL